jgi:hypothetical protein
MFDDLGLIASAARVVAVLISRDGVSDEQTVKRREREKVEKE